MNVWQPESEVDRMVNQYRYELRLAREECDHLMKINARLAGEVTKLKERNAVYEETIASICGLLEVDHG